MSTLGKCTWDWFTSFLYLRIRGALLLDKQAIPIQLDCKFFDVNALYPMGLNEIEP